MFAAAMTLLGILSYAAGFGIYIGALDWIYGQSIRSDLGFLIFASLFGYVVVACPAYVGIVYAIDRKIERFRLLLYPLACIAIFFVPTMLILFMYGGASPFSSEALLFHLFYTASGLVFGVGYGLIGKMNMGRFYEKKR